MRLLYKTIYHCGLLALALQARATAPNWTLNAADFANNMNVVAQIRLDGNANNSLGNKVGVFVGNNLRGTADPTIISGMAYYFITVYSNQNSGETLHFQVYTAADDLIHPVGETAVFQRNTLLGSQPAPFVLSIYSDNDFPISIGPIPAQLTMAGLALPGIELSTYLQSVDGDPVIWTSPGSAHGSAAFTGSTITITPNDAIWSGVETIMVTATETGTAAGHTASQSIEVTVAPSFTGPDFNVIVPQCIQTGGTFPDFDLDEVLEYTGSCRSLDYRLDPFTGTIAAPAWTQPTGGSGTMNIVAEVQFGQESVPGMTNKLAAFRGNTLVGVASPVMANNRILYFLNLQNLGNGALSFKFYHKANQYLYALPTTLTFVPGGSAGTINQPVAVQLSPLMVHIDPDGHTSVLVQNPAWTGSLSVHFLVEDCMFPLLRNDEVTVVYSVGIYTETASISISASDNNFCAGTSVTFTAQQTNGGQMPVYQWTLNGDPVGANSPQYSSSDLPNAGLIVCYLSSDRTCVAPAAVASNTIEMTVIPLPTLVCPPNQAVFTMQNTCTQTVAVPAPTLLGDCTAGVTMSNSFNNGSDASGTYLSGTTTVTWTAIGVSAPNTCSHTIEVTDNVAPMIVCPMDQTVTANANCMGTLTAYTPVSLSDNCSAVADIGVGQSPVAGAVLNGHNDAKTVTLTADDGHGNTQSCSFIVTLKDLTPPTVVCKSASASLNAAGTAGISTADVFQSGADNCNTVNQVSVLPNTFTCSNLGANSVTLLVNDGHGNTASCNAVVTVLAPEINLQGNGSTILDGDVTPSAGDHTDFGQTTGAPIVRTFTIQNTGAAMLPLGTNAITISGTDASLFSVGGITLPSAIAPAGTANFTVTYTPPAIGTHTATVNIANQDCDEPVYDFAVRGIRIPPYTTISGKIVFENDDVTGVKDVSVNLNGAATATTLTDINGDYSMTVNSIGNFTIQGVKNINRFNGVTTADVSRIQQHVIGNFPFTDPYKLFAADVNHNNSVSSQDVSILQQAILGNPSALAIFNVFWRFTAVPLNMPPWSQLPAAEQINLTGAIGNVPNQNFTGTKIGDVTAPSANPATGPSIISPLLWNIQDQTLTAGEEVTATFRAAHFEDLAAYQFGLGFDPERMQFIGWQSTGDSGLPINADNFGFYESEAGEIRSAWAQAGPATLAMETPVFALKFKVLENGGKLSEALWVDPETMPAVAYTPDFQPQEVLLEFVEGVTSTNTPIADGLQLLQNRPNPFNGETLIEFLMPQAGEARLRVFDGNGRMLAESVCDCAAGYHAQRFDLSGVLPGMLYYELTTPFGVRAKKMLRF